MGWSDQCIKNHTGQLRAVHGCGDARHCGVAEQPRVPQPRQAHLHPHPLHAGAHPPPVQVVAS